MTCNMKKCKCKKSKNDKKVKIERGGHFCIKICDEQQIRQKGWIKSFKKEKIIDKSRAPFPGHGVSYSTMIKGEFMCNFMVY